MMAEDRPIVRLGNIPQSRGLGNIPQLIFDSKSITKASLKKNHFFAKKVLTKEEIFPYLFL
jgi:hypothetical protein